MNEEYTNWEVYSERLIVSFGEIELLTYKLFESWVPDKEARKYTLGERLNKLIGHISRIDEQCEKSIRIKELLIEVRQLNEIRHFIAHNPTILKKFDESKYELLLSDLRGEKEPLSIEGLHEYADEAVSLKSELFILVSQYTNRGMDELIT